MFVFDCTGSILTNELLVKSYAGRAGAESADRQKPVTLDVTFDSKSLEDPVTSLDGGGATIKVNSMEALSLVDKHLK